MKVLIPLQKHSIPRLQTAWNYAQLGLFAFPLIPLVGALGLFLALIITWRQQHHKIIHRRLNWVLAILAIWLVITSGFAFDRSTAFLGLFNFLPFFGFFAAFSALIQTPAQLRQLARILVVTSVPVVIIGLGQLFLGWVSPVGLQAIVGWVILPNGNPLGRMASIFMYANVLAGYLVMVFILGLGLWIETFKEGRSREKASSYFLFVTVAVIGDLVALILTNSRSAWAIAICASLAFAIYQGWRHLVAGVAAIALCILGAAFGPAPVQQGLRVVVPTFFWARLTDQMYPNRPPALLRTTQWQFAWSLTQHRPWTGWGLRNFTSLYETQMHVWLGHPHNFLLMLTAETGIPSAVLYCGWVSWIIVQGFQLLRNWSAVDATDVPPRFLFGRHCLHNLPQLARDQLIFFSYFIAFFALMLFNIADVTLFDLRLNTLGWLLLSGICGIVYHQRQLSKKGF